jgi:predicted ATPase/DNA-binding SARP family transcriptional activator
VASVAIEFLVLGPLEVKLDGHPIDLGGRKRRLLLSMLLAHAGERVSTDRLIDALWGSESGKGTRHTLRVHISQLRGLLEPAHSKGDPWNVIETVEDGYRLRLNDATFDRDRFERLAEEGRRRLEERDGPGAARTFREALSLWRGIAFSELAIEPSLQAEATRLDGLRLATTEDRIEAELECGHHHEVIGDLRDLIDAHPFRERLRSLLMLALYRAGRQAEALRAYRALVHTLGEELGIEPGHEVSQLEQRILLQDPTLDLKPVSLGPGTNLPTPATSFVGRTGDMAILTELLETTRLITLLGPGGVGKTRLAVEAASGLTDRFPDGIWLVELAPIRDPALVGQAVLEVLRIDQQPDRPAEATLADALRDTTILLILDSCEHLVESVAALADTLLHACPAARLWATSREALGIRGEARLAVSGLSAPAGEPDAALIGDYDAVELFVNRAVSVDGTFRVSSENAPAVGQICRRLDGIPLAIELAAARVTVLTPEQIAAGLDDRFRLLTTGSRTADTRQQTLEAALDWSYNLLSESEQAGLRRLSVFRGTFGLDAARAVVDGSGDDTLDLLDRLAAKSLVVTVPAGPEMRYELLETVRFYARARLRAMGEHAAAEARHRDWYVAFAEKAGPKLRGAGQLAWLNRLEADHDNLRAALERSYVAGDIETPLRIAGSIAWFWFLHSHLAEGWDWLGKLITHDGHAPAILRVRVLIAAGQFAWEQSKDDRAERWLNEAVALAREIGSRTHAGWALSYLALLAVLEGRWDDGRQLAGQASELFQATGSLGGVGFVLWIDAGASYLAAREQGMASDSKDSMEQIEAMLDMAQAIGDRNFVGHLHWSLAIAAIDGDDHSGAAHHLAVALRSFDELGNKSCAGHTLDEAARLAIVRGAPKRAARLLAATEALRSGLGIPGHVFERRSWEHSRRQVADALDPHEYDEAWTDGSHMDLEQAVGYALSDRVR